MPNFAMKTLVYFFLKIEQQTLMLARYVEDYRGIAEIKTNIVLLLEGLS